MNFIEILVSTLRKMCDKPYYFVEWEPKSTMISNRWKFY